MANKKTNKKKSLLSEEIAEICRKRNERLFAQEEARRKRKAQGL